MRAQLGEGGGGEKIGFARTIWTETLPEEFLGARPTRDV